jgi:hypothetical protein
MVIKRESTSESVEGTTTSLFLIAGNERLTVLEDSEFTAVRGASHEHGENPAMVGD